LKFTPGLVLQRLLDGLFARNGDAVVANGVQEVDALAGGEDLLDPGVGQRLGDHGATDRVFVVPQTTLVLKNGKKQLSSDLQKVGKIEKPMHLGTYVP
jgi:hypothetical protein